MEIHTHAALEQGSPLTAYTAQVIPKNEEIVIKVSHCGVCHSDLHMIDNDWGMSSYPLVPGHEVVGEVVETGTNVNHLKIGDRVGVGWQRSACLHCDDCLNGDENLCADNVALIGEGFGGFADYLVVDSNFAFRLPGGIESRHAGPLMCGGITVYSALRHAGMGSGQRIGVIGIGGLGHMAVKFASALGNHVTAFTTSDDKFAEAASYGASNAINVKQTDLNDYEGKPFDILLSTIPAKLELEPYLNMLSSDGTLSFVGVPDGNLELPIFPLLMKRRRIMASPIGGRAMMRKMLNIADTYNIAPVIEEFAMKDANQAIQKVRDNSVRYRAVLVND